MSSRKYGIDYDKIIQSLKPFPEDITLYHVDHIKPLHVFNLTNSNEVKEAFNPVNLRWLIAHDNFVKNGKY